MKNMRKLLAVALAVMMVMSLATTAFAADADLSGHTYKAYQIFAGTQSTTDEKTELGNITWGSGINGDAFLAALKADTTIGSAFAACTSAADVAGVITGWGEEDAKAFAKIAYSYIVAGAGKACVNGETTLDAGYYLVVDETVFEEGAENTVYNLALLQLTKKGEFTIANKTDVPEVEKKVQDTNDTTGATTGWQDSADYDVTDSVPFQLTATLAGNVSDYNTYKIVFHDTLSAGLTYNGDAVVTFNGQNVTEYFTISCVDGKLTISCNDVKAFDATNNSQIVVNYTATLNENAVMGSAGNPNTVYLEYSNNPNWTGNGQPGTPGEPGEPGGEEPEEPTGKTPEDKVVVFTYKVIVNKVDENHDALVGAGFTLFKQTGTDEAGEAVWTQIGTEMTGDQMTQFVWERLDDGNYKLVETTTPAGYNTIDPIEFTITAEHDVTSADPQLISLDGGVLGTGEVSTGAITGEVVNQSGVELPETGGMGTTLFYTFGAMLALGAAVLLITKKRMSIAE